MKSLFKSVDLTKAVKSCPYSITLGVLGILGIATQPASAQYVLNSQSVYGPAGTFGSSAPSWIAPTTFSPTDFLSINLSGTVDLYSYNSVPGYVVNPGGVIVGPATGTVNTNNRPGECLFVAGSSTCYGALLIGNETLGFYNVFSPSESGLGSSTPPTALSRTDVPLSAIFTSPGFSGISAGTALEFRIAETNNFDNSGQFSVNGFSITALPTTGSNPGGNTGTNPGGNTGTNPGGNTGTNPGTGQEIPESTSTMSLLALGAFGAGSLIVRKRQLKSS